MKTAAEIAMERAEGLEAIPRMTHEYGRYWEQPKRSEITITDETATMTRTAFNKLHEYSGSNPTGAYEGKMWKRHDGGFDRAFQARGGKPEWLLCWYGVSLIGPGYVSNNRRKIEIVEDGAPDLGCSCCGK
jgi:hypothetical protein